MDDGHQMQPSCELQLIQEDSSSSTMIDSHPCILMDTEFPGLVVRTNAEPNLQLFLTQGTMHCYFYFYFWMKPCTAMSRKEIQIFKCS
jgi:hypothetical protein